MADEISIIDSTGTERFLGNIDRPTNLYQWKVYGDDVATTPMIPRDKWKPVSLSRWLSPIKNQGNSGSCNAAATVYAIEGARRFQGLPDVKLSFGHLYGKINGQRDQGSMLEDGLQESMKGGVASAKVVPEGEWHSGRWPSNAPLDALLYRVQEAFWCPSFEHQASAIQSGFFLITGIMWYGNYEPDEDGWLPERGTGRPGGHALCRDGLAFRDGKWGLDGPNSWSPDWGKDGRCVIPEAIYERERSIGGYWCIRCTVQEDADLPIAKT